jgi:hypothetical protein
MKKGLMVSLLVAVAAVVGSAQTSHALTLLDDLTQTVAARVQGAENQSDQAAEKQAELEARRQAIKQRITDRRAAVTEKLSGKRAEQCEQQEATINRVIDERANAAERHFTKFKAIQDKLATFVANKKLTIDNASAHELIIPGQEVAAQAAINELKAFDFECALADANTPGAIVTEQVAEVKQALKDYRTAIKDYAVAIRSAIDAQDTTEPTDSETQSGSDSDASMENQETTR